MSARAALAQSTSFCTVDRDDNFSVHLNGKSASPRGERRGMPAKSDGLRLVFATRAIGERSSLLPLPLR